MINLKESLLDDEDILMDNTNTYNIIKNLILSHCNTSGHCIEKWNHDRELSKIDPILKQNFDKIFTINTNGIIDINISKDNKTKIKNISIYLDEEFCKYAKFGNYTNDYKTGKLYINSDIDINKLEAKNGIPDSITGYIRIKANHINNLDFTKVKTNNKTIISIWNSGNNKKLVNFSNTNVDCLSLEGDFDVIKFPNANRLELDRFAAGCILEKLTSIKNIIVYTD